MTDFSLNSVSIFPLTKSKPKKIIILCHGYGGDGKDISVLGINWQRFIPDAIFLCPNAPEICVDNPTGYQWFDLRSSKEEIVLEKSLEAEKKLNKFIDKALDNFNLNPKNLAIAGFSQGCMISIQTALKKKEEISCVIGYSGKIINQNHLSKNINSKPKILLVHGSDDTIVPPIHLLEAKEYLKKHSIKTQTKMFKNCEHKIPVEGSSLGLTFLKKNLL